MAFDHFTNFLAYFTDSLYWKRFIRYKFNIYLYNNEPWAINGTSHPIIESKIVWENEI